MTLLVGLTVLTSCNKEMFDQKIYDEIVNTTFPIEPVDATHTWTTTTRRSVVVNVNGKLGEMEKLQVLTADPSSSSSTPQIMAEEIYNESGPTGTYRPCYGYIDYENGETGAPAYGLYYKFTPSASGKLRIPKPFRITSKDASPNGIFMASSCTGTAVIFLPAAPFSIPKEKSPSTATSGLPLNFS